MKRTRNIVIILLVLALVGGLGAFFYSNVIDRPFPFFRMAYVRAVEDFNAPPAGFERAAGLALAIPVGADAAEQARQRALAFKEAPGKDFDDDVRAAAMAVRAAMKDARGKRARGPDDLFSDDPSLIHICSDAAKMYCVTAQALGHPCRVVWTHGHTVAEVYGEKAGWVLTDPYGNVWFSDENGRPLSLLDVRSGFSKARARRLAPALYPANADYLGSGYLDTPGNVFAENNCYVVMDGGDLFTFDDVHDRPGPVAKSFFLADGSVGRAVQ